MFLRRPLLLPLLLLLAVAASTALYGVNSLRQEREQLAQRFADDAAAELQRIRDLMGVYEYGLRGARGAVIGAGGASINQQRFGDYVRSRDLPREFRGALGFGFARRVNERDTAAFEKAASIEAGAPFSLRQLAAHAGERWVVHYFEPLAAAGGVLGLDLASDARYRDAALAAMRSGQAVITAPVPLGPEPAVNGEGIWMLMPVYQAGAMLDVADARERATIGWTLCPLNLREVLESVRASQPGLQFSLIDTDSSNQPLAFYQSGPTGPLLADGLQQRFPLELFGRRWQVNLQTLPSYNGGQVAGLPWRPMVLQLALGLLMAFGLHLYLQGREKARPLALNQARLTAIMNGTDAAMIGKTTEGIITSWNRAAESLFGYTAAEAEGHNIRDLVVPPHLFDEQQALGLRVAQGETVSGRATQRRHRDGHLLDVDLSLCPVRDELGHIVGVASIVHDVTRHRQVERAVQELTLLTAHSVGEDFLDRAVEALSRVLGADFVLIGQALNQPTTRVRVLSALQDGQRRQSWEFDLADTPCEQIYRAAGLRQEDAILIDDVSVIQHEVHRRFDMATESHYQGFLVLPLWDESGSMLGHIGALFAQKVEPQRQSYLIEVGRLFARRVESELQRLLVERQRDDVLDQLRALNTSLEQQVNERTATLSTVVTMQTAILANSGYAVIAVDPDGLITRFNPAAEQLLGYRADEMVGLHTPESFHLASEVVARVEQLRCELGVEVPVGFEAFTTKATMGLPDQAEWTYVRKDGQQVPVLLSITSLLDAAGSITGFMGMAVDLSERKRLETALKQSGDHYKSVLDLAPSAILTIDSAGQIETVNAQTQKMFGYTSEELIGKPIEMLIPVASQAGHRALQQGFLSANSTGSRQMSGRTVSARHRDGREIPVDVRLSRYDSDDGIKAIAIATDRSQELMLGASEFRWRSMTNSLPQMIWTATPDGAWDFLSTQWQTYTGMSEEQLNRSAAIDAMHPDDRSFASEQWLASIANRTEFKAEVRIVRHDGVYRWFETRAVGVRDGEGKLVKWLGAYTDIDDRKRAEEDTRTLNQRLEQRVTERTQMLESARRDLQTILDAIPSAIGYWDSKLINRFANKAYSEWFGIDPAGLPGTHIGNFLGEATYQANLPHMEAALAGKPQEFERLLGRRYSLLRYIPDVQSGKVCGFYAVVTDISEIRRATEAVEAANVAKSAFLANMSHEIRTPMNAILGLLRLLERTGLDARQADYLGKTDTAARGLLAILNDILDFSKLEAGKLELEQKPFEIDQVMRQVGVILSANAGEKPVEILFDIDPNAPTHVIGDALRLQQVLVNLAGNALKFTECGEVVVSLQMLRIAHDLAVLTFAVRDTGIGIAPEALDRIFSVFMQAENSTARRFGGTGLGLAISQQLANLMGGELKVQSTLGQGSTFSLTLTMPLATAPPVQRPAPRAAQRLRVLVIDDNANALSIISTMANSLGWSFELAASGAEGLQKITAAKQSGEPFQALFVDALMPDMDGWQTVAAVRKESGNGSLPIIMMTTAQGSEQLAEYSAKPDVPPLDGFLVKPITASMLQDAMADALAGRSDLKRAHAGTLYAGPMRLQGLNILLVEDNATNRLVASELLTAEGAEISIATGGQQAIDKVRQDAERFDLVLMDLQMPEMDGYATTREIRETLGAISLPIVAMTANAMESDRLACLQAGMKDHVGKPFDLDRLLEVILLHSRRQPVLTNDQRRNTAAVRQSAEMPDIPGVETSVALARIGGNRALYADLISNFLVDAPALLQQAVTDGPLGAGSARVRAIHTLKSLAGTLGLTSLATQAAELESAGRASTPDFNIQLDGFSGALLSATELVQSLLQQLVPEQSSAPSAIRDPLPNGDLQSLITLLRKSDGRAIALFDELSDRYAWADTAKQHQLGSAIRELDFSVAATICQTLLASA